MRPLVERLFDETLSLSAVLEQLQSDATLSAAAKTAGLRLAAASGFELDSIVRGVDLVVHDGQRSATEYARALSRARALQRALPNDAAAVRRLGYAQFRAGELESALTSFQRARQMARGDGIELGFEAMTHARLRQAPEARDALRRFEEVIRRAGLDHDYQMFRVLTEAQEAVGTL